MGPLSIFKRFVPMSGRLLWNVVKARAVGEKELAYVRALCDPLALSLDVGANRGVYSYIMRKHSRSVIAFEPNPFYADFVRRSLRDVEVIEAAVSDQEGASELRIPLFEAVAGMGTIETQNTLPGLPTQSLTIPTLTLDSLPISRVGFMKIDVEGHELAALQGAKKTIRRDKPNLLIEAEERHRKHAVTSVWHLLAGYGYQGFFHTKAKLHPMDRFSSSDNQDPAGEPGSYVNNFIFVHSSKLETFFKKQGISKP